VRIDVSQQSLFTDPNEPTPPLVGPRYYVTMVATSVAAAIATAAVAAALTASTFAPTFIPTSFSAALGKYVGMWQWLLAQHRDAITALQDDPRDHVKAAVREVLVQR